MIDGKTKLYGVLGKPVSHSLSPAIHNFSAKSLGLNICYVPISAEIEDCEEVLNSAWNLGFRGLNITVPFKEKVADLFPESGLQSVNTLRRSDAGWDAFSTDGNGFIESVLKMGIDPKSFEQFICLGNGGAALSVLSELSNRFPHVPIKVLRRSESKDELFRKWMVRSNISFDKFEPAALAEKLNHRTLLIQSTSAPLSGDRLESFGGALKKLNGLFIDMLYGSSVSSLVEVCEANGVASSDGLGMLIGQAIESQKIWWGKSIGWQSVESELKALI